jgi:prevent-host-death family protein
MLPLADDYKTVTDLRENTIALLRLVEKKRNPTIIVHRNSPKAVMMSITRYNRMLQLLEDRYDEQLAAALEKEPKKKGIPLEEVAEELGVKLDE